MSLFDDLGSNPPQMCASGHLAPRRPTTVSARTTRAPGASPARAFGSAFRTERVLAPGSRAGEEEGEEEREEEGEEEIVSSRQSRRPCGDLSDHRDADNA